MALINLSLPYNHISEQVSCCAEGIQKQGQYFSQPLLQT